MFTISAPAGRAARGAHLGERRARDRRPRGTARRPRSRRRSCGGERQRIDAAAHHRRAGFRRGPRRRERATIRARRASRSGRAARDAREQPAGAAARVQHARRARGAQRSRAAARAGRGTTTCGPPPHPSARIRQAPCAVFDTDCAGRTMASAAMPHARRLAPATRAGMDRAMSRARSRRRSPSVTDHLAKRRRATGRGAPLGAPVAAWRAAPARGWCSCCRRLLPALLFLPVVLAPPLNHDVAAVLDFSERWLAGERLYTDLIDVNPPLIFVLNLIPAAIARVTPLGRRRRAAALPARLGACSPGGWPSRVRDRARRGPTERAFLDVLPVLFLFGAGYDFGQREHLMAVAALPYLLAAARREGGARPRPLIASALFAAVGFALKPHFLAIPALVELRRAARPESRDRGWSAGAARARCAIRCPGRWPAVWAVYLVSLPLVFPDYLDVVVPLVWDFYLDLGGLDRAGRCCWCRAWRRRCACCCRCCGSPRGRPARRRHRACRACSPPRRSARWPRRWRSTRAGRTTSCRSSYFTLRARRGARGRLARPRGAVSHARAARAAHRRRRSARLIALYAISNGEAPWKEIDYADERGGRADRAARRRRRRASACWCCRPASTRSSRR